jgi:hypothetical protein
MDEVCVYFYLFNFYRSDPLILVLYGDVILFEICPKQIMMWFPNILAHEIYMKDVGVWKVVDGIWLYSFIFTSGQAPRKEEILDIVLVCSSVGCSRTFKTLHDLHYNIVENCGALRCEV